MAEASVFAIAAKVTALNQAVRIKFLHLTKAAIHQTQLLCAPLSQDPVQAPLNRLPDHAAAGVGGLFPKASNGSCLGTR